MSRLKKGKRNVTLEKKTNAELRKRVLKLNKTNVKVGEKRKTNDQCHA